MSHWRRRRVDLSLYGPDELDVLDSTNRELWQLVAIVGSITFGLLAVATALLWYALR